MIRDNKGRPTSEAEQIRTANETKKELEKARKELLEKIENK